MGKLKVYSTFLIELNKTSTFPFNISSYTRDMITLIIYLIEPSPDYAKTYYFISWFILKMIQKTGFHAFLIKNTVHSPFRTLG